MKSVYEFPCLDPQQTLAAPVAAWESDLADAIEAAFAKGHHALPDLVAALNRSRVRPSAGGAWTEENFTAMVRDLGTLP
jgi:hypothetical protein